MRIFVSAFGYSIWPAEDGRQVVGTVVEDNIEIFQESSLTVSVYTVLSASRIGRPSCGVTQCMFQIDRGIRLFNSVIAFLFLNKGKALDVPDIIRTRMQEEACL